MTIAVEVCGEVAVFEVPYESISASVVEQFKLDLQHLCEAQSNVILDLESVHFVDSAGLGAMVWAFRQLALQGGELRICNLNGQVKDVFDLVRMSKLLDVFESQQEALESLVGH